MTDKTKSLLITQTQPNFRYSQSSLNSTQTSENDYNLYCFSQGYKNHEKGYWRGVLRNKNIDFDLRFNKDWNRRIELEPDDGESLFQSSTQFSNDFIKFINDNDIGWDTGLFQNFKKKQSQAGVKKQKNKEWLLSNGVKRSTVAVELRTQNYKQFEANEKNKELKKAYLQNKAKLEEQYVSQKGKQYDYSDKKIPTNKFEKTYKTSADTINLSKSLSSSANINEQKGTYNRGDKIKRIESGFMGDKKETDYTKRNLATEYNKDQYKRAQIEKNISSAGKDKGYDLYSSKTGLKTQTKIDVDKYKTIRADQGYRKPSPKGYEKQTGYYSGKKDYKTEFRYGQKGNYSDQKNLLIKKSSDFDRPDNLGRLEVSVEKKNKQKIEIM